MKGTRFLLSHESAELAPLCLYPSLAGRVCKQALSMVSGFLQRVLCCSQRCMYRLLVIDVLRLKTRSLVLGSLVKMQC